MLAKKSCLLRRAFAFKPICSPWKVFIGFGALCEPLFCHIEIPQRHTHKK